MFTGGRALRRTAVAVGTSAVLIAGVATVPESAAAQPIHVGGGVNQAYLTDARPGTALTLVDAAGARAGSGVADSMGSLIVRDLQPGGYRFVGAGIKSAPVTVTGADSPPPAPSLYGQTLHEGLNYITMRDGVSLAATVRLPYGKKLSDGPFPTVIEYSGYQNAAPDDLIVGAVGEKVGVPDPQAPASSVIVGATLATQMLGFATVSLQMRGSGCSGGDFGLFDDVAAFDAYDAIETVGRQHWVSGNKVGMVGISFSGISQMYAAGTRPPHLAAIAPMSTTDDLYSTGLPGGIYNKGFANSWLRERVEQAQPGPRGGQPWVRARIDAGDKTCANNQKLRRQTRDVFKLIRDNPTRAAKVYQERSIPEWTERIDVPVFLVGAAQDEQTGPNWVNLIKHLGHNRDVWVNIVNGHHFDSLGPQILSRWAEFLQIFVANQVPHTPPNMQPLGTVVFPAATSAPGQTIPPVRFSDARSVADAKARFRAGTPRLWALFDNGGGSAGPGGLSSPWQRSLGGWPASAERMYLSDKGRLGTAPGTGTVSFRPDPHNRPLNTLANASTDTAAAWGVDPAYDWRPAPGRSGLGFISAPLTRDKVMLGNGSVTLQVSSTAKVTDLQVTVSEVNAKGQETSVGTGVLRSSFRGDGLAPDYTRQSPLNDGFNQLTIPINPVMHGFRKGSRIRITVSAPGGDLPSWQFSSPATGGKVVDTVDLSRSYVMLPVISGDVPGAGPDCGFLRGSACRSYRPAFNGG
ncbi:CocE/NonD family hydrolase [Gordonia neofelifaecis]|uniref:Peptidase S15 n=1 Tax=Gordonia neofelifaecis NRRL B-59395 TaxID=644548 RepID=F1YNZ7_9ACTN|nr:CocE/NonD family hydrolase [Gordonia neofelifaecis]EGD53616.1 peptidase S15 [Gordonia neofelifaecis NRRL B-59395]